MDDQRTVDIGLYQVPGRVTIEFSFSPRDDEEADALFASFQQALAHGLTAGDLVEVLRAAGV